MKKILLLIGILLLFDFGYAQNQFSSTENYIYSKTYLDYNGSLATKTTETVQYFDGLGRPKQIVNVKASPQGKDVVTHIEYDGFGRQVKEYLPVPQQGTQNGGIYTSPLNNATQPSLYGAEKIYAEKILENSPLDRILQQKQVGIAWNNTPIQFEYNTNTIEEVKKYITVTSWTNGATTSLLKVSESYSAMQLYKNKIIDEDGNETIEFKNSQGQTILVRKMLSTTKNVDTYYIYNEYNQLAYILSPQAVEQIKNLSVGMIIKDNILNELCYQYRYDSKNRIVEKKLPGKGWEYMVYDKADQLILTQDANLNIQNKWLITKYDKFGRVAYTGFLEGGSRITRQNEIENIVIAESRNPTGFTKNGIIIYYTNGTFANEISTILNVNYYDSYPNYSFDPPFPTNILGESTLSDSPSPEGFSTKGLPVMNLIKNIEDNSWTKNYLYYDKKGRTIGTYSINHLGGRTKVDYKLDFTGVVQQIVTKHKRLDTNTDKTITENFTYDAQNRLLTHTHQVDNNPIEYLAQNTYNELSQITHKKVGGNVASSPLQDITYTYNIRGWMTKINDPANLNGKLFGYEMRYNKVEGLQSPDPLDTNLQVMPKFNGNIVEIDWRTNTVQGDYLRRYGYVYDKLNRLTAGFYQNDANPSAKEYFEKLTYDLNGNIMTLKRTASLDGNTTAGLIDNLTYIYENNNKSNKILSIIDSSTDYRGYPEISGNIFEYDNNGNMIKHKDKGILQIIYNHLNLPNYIVFDKDFIFTDHELILPSSYINSSYLYRADGIKLKKIHTKGGNNSYGVSRILNEYLDNFHYQGISKAITIDPIPELQFIPTSEGYYDFKKNAYIYNYVDHLGNVRLSYRKNSAGVLEVIEENNYYPFGLKHQGYNGLVVNPVYQYKYNGKELQETGMYDYGARFYMPDIGRWGVVDPLAEKYPSWSPYVYSFNNPVRFGDPTGMEPEDWIKQGNRIFYDASITGTSEAQAKYGNDAIAITGYHVTKNDVTTHYDLGKDGSITTTVGNLDFLANTRSVYSTGNIETGAATIEGQMCTSCPTISRIPESRGKTQIQMMVAENPLVQDAVIGAVTAGAGSWLTRSARGAALADDAYSLYYGLDAAGNVKYVGITSRNPAVRFLEHAAAGGERGALFFETQATGLTKLGARVLEQNAINYWGLQKNGGQLLNKINSIAPKNWATYGVTH